MCLMIRNTTDTETDSFMYLRFLHCSGNKNEYGKNMTDCENDKLSDTYAKYYSPTEHLAVKIIVLFKVESFSNTV